MSLIKVKSRRTGKEYIAQDYLSSGGYAKVYTVSGMPNKVLKISRGGYPYSPHLPGNYEKLVSCFEMLLRRRHPNVCQLYDWGRYTFSDGVLGYWYVMEKMDKLDIRKASEWLDNNYRNNKAYGRIKGTNLFHADAHSKNVMFKNGKAKFVDIESIYEIRNSK